MPSFSKINHFVPYFKQHILFYKKSFHSNLIFKDARSEVERIIRSGEVVRNPSHSKPTTEWGPDDFPKDKQFEPKKAKPSDKPISPKDKQIDVQEQD
ncbi:hypothetical protein ABK040_014715 [Willaertia magna]